MQLFLSYQKMFKKEGILMLSEIDFIIKWKAYNYKKEEKHTDQKS